MSQRHQPACSYAACLILAAAFTGTAHPLASSSPPAQGRSLGNGAEVRWHGAVARGRTIEIKGVNGDVRTVAGMGADVEVVATKTSRRSDLESVSIDVVEHEDGVTLCAMYPDSDREPNVCAPGSKGHMNTNNNDVNVSFTVSVPAGVKFVGRTVNGDVSGEGLKADSEAYTVNGSIRLSTTGAAQAETVNGSIAASLGDANWSDNLEFRTVNGGITLDLPASVSATLRAETVNGQIDSDFPMTITGRFSPRRVRGTIGTAVNGVVTHELDVSTVNGTIRLRKGQ